MDIFCLYCSKLLKGIEGLNYRQKALLCHALRKLNGDCAVNSHKASHDIAYATAGSDLLDLVDHGLLLQRTIGNALLSMRGLNQGK
jgi:hypothetical protein